MPYIGLTSNRALLRFVGGPLSSHCFDQGAFDLEIEIAEEQRQQKPHLTKAVSQSRLEAT